MQLYYSTGIFAQLRGNIWSLTCYTTDSEKKEEIHSEKYHLALDLEEYLDFCKSISFVGVLNAPREVPFHCIIVVVNM